MSKSKQIPCNFKPDSDHQEAQTPSALEKTLHLGTFTLGQTVYAANILQFREIVQMQEVFVLPTASAWVEGLINLRGAIIPIINLRKLFGIAPTPISSQARIITVDSNNQILGLLVDNIGKMYHIPAHTVEPLPPKLLGAAADFVHGICKIENNLLILLDLNLLCSQ